MSKESLISRYSNDYFAVLFECEDNIRKIVNKIVRNIENLKIDNNVYNLSVNMGIYKLTDADNNIAEAMDKAIIAHSASKGDVFDKYHIYNGKIEKEIERESKIENEMYQALMNKKFKVYYQPKIYTKEETLYGVEALVRWEHNGKMVPPSEFIPLFEKNRFILKAAKYGVDTSKIDLEITESATIEAGIDIIEIRSQIATSSLTKKLKIYKKYLTNTNKRSIMFT